MYSTGQNTNQIITVSEARKILGEDVKHLTNEEIRRLITESEQMVRVIIKPYLVRKSDMVK